MDRRLLNIGLPVVIAVGLIGFYICRRAGTPPVDSSDRSTPPLESSLKPPLEFDRGAQGRQATTDPAGWPREELVDILRELSASIARPYLQTILGDLGNRAPAELVRLLLKAKSIREQCDLLVELRNHTPFESEPAERAIADWAKSQSDDTLRAESAKVLLRNGTSSSIAAALSLVDAEVQAYLANRDANGAARADNLFRVLADTSIAPPASKELIEAAFANHAPTAGVGDAALSGFYSVQMRLAKRAMGQIVRAPDQSSKDLLLGYLRSGDGALSDLAWTCMAESIESGRAASIQQIDDDLVDNTVREWNSGACTLSQFRYVLSNLAARGSSGAQALLGLKESMAHATAPERGLWLRALAVTIEASPDRDVMDELGRGVQSGVLSQAGADEDGATRERIARVLCQYGASSDLELLLQSAELGDRYLALSTLKHAAGESLRVYVDRVGKMLDVASASPETPNNLSIAVEAYRRLLKWSPTDSALAQRFDGTELDRCIDLARTCMMERDYSPPGAVERFRRLLENWTRRSKREMRAQESLCSEWIHSEDVSAEVLIDICSSNTVPIAASIFAIEEALKCRDCRCSEGIGQSLLSIHARAIESSRFEGRYWCAVIACLIDRGVDWAKIEPLSAARLADLQANALDTPVTKALARLQVAMR